MKKILLTGFILFSLVGLAMSQSPFPSYAVTGGFELSDEWTEYISVEGIKIEYKMTQNESIEKRSQNLLLFKFSNTSDQALTLTWVTKEFRNGECSNCNRLDNPEYAHSKTFAPGQIFESDGSSHINNEMFIFGNFVKLVPGMTEQSLTGFEFVDIAIH